jgi:hypothetical protein
MTITWLLLTAYCVTCLMLIASRITKDRIILSLICAQILIRFIYCHHTPITLRAHDVFWAGSGHVNYIMFVASHWRLPPGSGWEFHQAPLYYFLAALFMKAGNIAHLPEQKIFALLQVFSALITSGMVLVTAWIGAMVWPKKHDRIFQVLLLLLVSLPTWIVFMSSQISNDGLLTFFMLLGAAVIVRWHQKPSAYLWYWCIVIAALAFLTKLNGIALFFACITCLLVHQGTSFHDKTRMLVMGALLFFVMTAWLPALRLMQDTQSVQNTFSTGLPRLEGIQRYPDSVQNFLAFNPFAILQRPFTDDMTAQEGAHYAEFFFRSAFFGEFTQYRATILIPYFLAASIVLLPWTVAGFIISLSRKQRPYLPIVITGLSVVGLSILYNIYSEYNYHQGFRLAAASSLFFAYCTVRGLHSSKGYLLNIGMTFAFTATILTSVFTLLQ